MMTLRSAVFHVVGALLACVACSAQTAPDRLDRPAEADVLTDSEIRYTESGGLAGRVREARLVASGGAVAVEYRAGTPRTAMVKGTMASGAFLALWKEAERIGVWTLTPRGKSAGADLIESELFVRTGPRSHTVQWDTGNATPDAARLGEQILEAAQRATTVEQ